MCLTALLFVCVPPLPHNLVSAFLGCNNLSVTTDPDAGEGAPRRIGRPGGSCAACRAPCSGATGRTGVTLGARPVRARAARASHRGAARGQANGGTSRRPARTQEAAGGVTLRLPARYLGERLEDNDDEVRDSAQELLELLDSASGLPPSSALQMRRLEDCDSSVRGDTGA